ncbi:glycosyltransferase [Spirochaeta isovalerica]
MDPLLQRLVPVLESTALLWNVLFVDDGSRDGTFGKLKEVRKSDSRIRGIRLAENRGQQNAVYCGLCQADSELIITMDDDLQHPPELIPELISRVSDGADLVYAVSRGKGRPFLLRGGTALNSLFFTLFLRKPSRVEIGSYRIFTRSLVDRIKGEKRAFIYVSALVFRLRPGAEVRSFRFSKVPSVHREPSRFSFRGRVRLFSRLFRHYGPFRFLFLHHGEPYRIEEVL